MTRSPMGGTFRFGAVALPLLSVLLYGALAPDAGAARFSIEGAWQYYLTAEELPGVLVPQLVVFTDGGQLFETDAFLHENSELLDQVCRCTASPALGSWTRGRPWEFSSRSRKLLFASELTSDFGVAHGLATLVGKSDGEAIGVIETVATTVLHGADESVVRFDEVKIVDFEGNPINPFFPALTVTGAGTRIRP